MRRLAPVALLAVLCTWLATALADGPISSQGPAQSPTTGYIDPTVATWNASHPMVSCSSSCSTALADQNRNALQLAIATANSDHRWIYLPPGEYPMSRSATNILIGIDFSGTSNIVISMYGATLRAQGDLGGHDLTMLSVRNTSHVRFMGGTFSVRDVTNYSSQTHELGLGDGGSNVDDVQIIDGTFTESLGGDCVRTLGSLNFRTTRITIANNRFLDCHRDAISIQSGVQRVNILDNTIDLSNSGSNEDIDFEPTSTGDLGMTTITGNWMTRTSTPVIQTVTLVGNTAAWPAEQVFFDRNIMNGGTPGVADGKAIWMDSNVVLLDRGTTATGVVEVAGSFDIWITNNWLKRGPNATNGSLIYQHTANSRTPDGLMVRGNRMYQYAGLSQTVLGDGATHFTWSDNTASYNASTADSGANGFIGFDCRSATGHDCQGQIVGNSIKRGKLSDDTTTAGRMLAGINIGKNSSTTISSIIARDNRIDGARACHYSTGTLSGNWPAGYMLVPGDTCVNYVNDFEGAPPAYRRESTVDSEQLTASGAVSRTKRMTFVVGDCSSDSFTLADGVRGGLVKHVEVNASCASAGTLTPTNFGDGTSISWLADNTHPTASADLAWDDVSGKWWLLNNNRMTVNP